MTIYCSLPIVLNKMKSFIVWHVPSWKCALNTRSKLCRNTVFLTFHMWTPFLSGWSLLTFPKWVVTSWAESQNITWPQPLNWNSKYFKWKCLFQMPVVSKKVLMSFKRQQMLDFHFNYLNLSSAFSSVFFLLWVLQDKNTVKLLLSKHTQVLLLGCTV